MMFSTWACTDTSRAEVGSSQTRNSGCVARARAMLMRWRWPPENCVRELEGIGRRHAHLLQQFAHPRVNGGGIAEQAVFQQRLGHDVAHTPARIQAGIGVLEDHLHAAAQLRRRG